MTTKITVRGASRTSKAPLTTEMTGAAMYPCEQISAGIETLPSHYPDYTGYFTASELRYLSFEIVQHNAIYGGYWCEGCITALGKRPGNTLAEDLQAEMMTRLQDSIKAFIS